MSARAAAGPIAVGDELIAYRILGGYADSVTVPASEIVPKPPGLSWQAAACRMLSGTTAIHMLTATGVTDDRNRKLGQSPGAGNNAKHRGEWNRVACP